MLWAPCSLGQDSQLEHLGWEAGKNWVENTRAVKIPSSTVRAGHCSAPLLSDRHTEVGKDTLQIQKWRVEIKACNCRFFSCRDFPLPLTTLPQKSPSSL